MKKYLLVICLLLSSLNIFAQFEAVKKAAEEGDISAQMYMGQIYEEGSLSQGIDKDLKAAIEWYLKAAAKGNYWCPINFLIGKKKIGLIPFCGFSPL